MIDLLPWILGFFVVGILELFGALGVAWLRGRAAQMAASATHSDGEPR